MYLPIHRACEAGDLGEVKKLLTSNPQMAHSRTAENDQPLHFAAQHNHVAIARLLLDNGADVNARGNHDFTPLHYAAHYGCPECAELLVDSGVDLEAVDDHGW